MRSPVDTTTWAPRARLWTSRTGPSAVFPPRCGPSLDTSPCSPPSAFGLAPEAGPRAACTIVRLVPQAEGGTGWSTATVPELAAAAAPLVPLATTAERPLSTVAELIGGFPVLATVHYTKDEELPVLLDQVVFSGKAPVAAATRDRVMAAAAELGYAGPDPRAASLRRGRSGIVAVVLEEHLRTAFRDPVKIAMMDGLTDARAGRRGVLIGCSGRTRETLASVRARGLPVVVIEGDVGVGVPRIELDNRRPRARSPAICGLGHKRVGGVTLPLSADRSRGEVTEAPGRGDRRGRRERLQGTRDVFPDARAVSAAGSFIDEGMIAGRTFLEGGDTPDRRRGAK